jgi:energy-coupling factor transporter ATP-binding protein EcfA2
VKIENLLPKESWFRKYMQLWPTSEPPESFILFAAMSVFGACLGRRVWFDQDVHTIYPMMSTLLIGPSGTGKSTSAKMAFKLVKSLPKEEQPQIIAGAATPEKLHDDLRMNPHAILFASELANFFTRQKYMEGMIPYVTQLLDYEDKLERRTIGGGIVEIERPSVTVLGCSTSEWLQDQLPDTATSGGFLARFLIVHEEHKSKSVALPGRALSVKQREKLEDKRKEAFDEFRALVTQNVGSCVFDNREVDDTYTQWYDSHKPASGHLAPFAARAGEYVLRLAVILAVSCDRTIITADDIKSAIALYKLTERKLQEVIVPMSPQGKLLAKVLEAVGTDAVTDTQVRRAMRNHCTAQDADRLIESLLKSGDLRRGVDQKLYKV